MINNRLKKRTTNIASSERYGAIKIGDCVIVNVYLPCSGTENRMLIIDDVLTVYLGVNGFRTVTTLSLVF